MPYTWGTTGLIYNTTMVDEAPTKWADLWSEEYTNNVLMFNNSRDAYAIAAKKIGCSMNPTTVEEVTTVMDELKKQKNIVQAYVMDEIFDKMEGGEAAMAPYYAGDALTMIDENPDLAFVHPEEGVNFFVDSMCIPANAKNKEAAEMFINYMCEPDVGLANCDYIGYSTPETAAKDYLDEEVTSSPVSYPDDETLARSESFAELGVEATQVMNDLWLSVKTSTSNTTLYLILTIAAIAAVILFFVISGIVRRRKKARRCRKWKQA